MNQAPPHAPGILAERFRRWGEALDPDDRRFLLATLIIVIIGALLRTYRFDMPPIDYPADRQRTNMIFFSDLFNGRGLPDPGGFWFELPVLPWLVAQSHRIGRLLGIEPWTQARLWSILAGSLTVALAPLVAWLAPGSHRADPGRRRRLALLFAAALAFNPYHVTLSRMILTEPVTLFFQMAALAAFFFALREPGRWWRFIGFAVLLALAGMAKIPSVIWLPAFGLYVLFYPTVTRSVRWLGAGLCVAGFAAILLHYRINPLTATGSFRETYWVFMGTLDEWMGTAPWDRAYLSRLTMMLTLPGALLAVVGLLCAPWIFRLTLLVFAVLFHFLVFLNTYNFCHVIIPGMALAAWGANAIYEAAMDRPGPAGELALAGRRALIGAVGVLFLMVGYRLGPDPLREQVPRPGILEAVEVLRHEAPHDVSVLNDDFEGSLGLMREYGYTSTVVPWQDMQVAPLDLRTGYFYMFERFRPETVEYAAQNWVKWASLPGEPLGLLLVGPGEAVTQPGEDSFMPVPNTIPAAEGALGIERFWLPTGLYDRYKRELTVRPGMVVRMGIEWKNAAGYPLAGIHWSSVPWRRYVAVPVRRGGFSVQWGGVLCLPSGVSPTAFYTFEIPENFPPGPVAANVYGQPAGKWISSDAIQPFPFSINVEPKQKEAERAGEARRLFSELYPVIHNVEPIVWSKHWLFSLMRLEGYRTNTAASFIMARPGSDRGRYRVSIRGEARPMLLADKPGPQWPVVQVRLPGAEAAATSVTLSSESTDWFTAEFEASRTFDSMMFSFNPEPSGADHGPVWTRFMQPRDLGRQTVMLREVRLEKIDD